MTPDEYMRLQDDGNPHCDEHIRTMTIGGFEFVVIGHVMLVVREVYGGRLERNATVNTSVSE